MLNSNNNSILIFTIIFFIINLYKNKKIKFNKKLAKIILIYINFAFNFKINKLKYFLKSFKIINTSLINGLIIIHPICMYITYVLYILIFLYYKKFFKKTNLFLKKFNYNLPCLIVYSFSSLILGCY